MVFANADLLIANVASEDSIAILNILKKYRNIFANSKLKFFPYDFDIQNIFQLYSCNVFFQKSLDFIL